MSKKKIIVRIVAALLMLAVFAGAMTGCTFIKENGDRVANETLVTIKGANGITLTISNNEIMDYFNNYAYYLVNYYSYTVEKALDYCIESKIKTKFLVTEAMVYLTSSDKVSAERIAALYGKGSIATPENVLTLAERAAAIYAVNRSVMDTIESAREEEYQSLLAEEATAALKEVDNAGGKIKEIIFTDDTAAFLKETYNRGYELDTDKIKIQIVYTTGSEKDNTLSEHKSAAFIVPSSYYTTAYAGGPAADETNQQQGEKTPEREEAADKTPEREEAADLVISLSHSVTAEDGTESNESFELTHSYTIVTGRTEKTEEEPEYGNEFVQIGDAYISRYLASASEIENALKAALQDLDKTDDEINTAIKFLQKYDFGAEHKTLKTSSASGYKNIAYYKATLEAYRSTLDNFKTASKDMTYFYSSQFESQTISALQAEIYLKTRNALLADEAAATNQGVLSQIDKTVVEQFKYLYETGSKSYVADPKKDNTTLAGAISGGLSSLYYYPTDLENLSDYFYVSQILFNYSDEQKAHIANFSNDSALEAQINDYFLNELGVYTKATVSDYDPETGSPFAATEENVLDVIADLEASLQAIYAGYDGSNLAEIEAAALAEFDRYLYLYNDDPGIFNKDPGYLIAANEDDNSWYENFTNLANELKSDSFSVGNAFKNLGAFLNGEIEADELELNYTYTPYGIHLLMISYIPFEDAALQAAVKNGDGSWNDAAILAYLKRNINVAGDNLYDTIRDGVISAKENAVYTEFAKTLPTDIYEVNADKKYKVTVLKDEIEKSGYSLTMKKKKIQEIYQQYAG